MSLRTGATFRAPPTLRATTPTALEPVREVPPPQLGRACGELAVVAGALLRERFARPREVGHKDGTEMVTDADRLSEALILSWLGHRFPGDAVVSEESGTFAGRTGRRWIVDPLDGTHNYAHGVPLFAVNIAVEDSKGLLAAATYDPMRGELFQAVRGEGATLNGKPIRTSGRRALSEALLLTDLGYQVEQQLPRRMAQLQEGYRTARSVRMLGSTALAMAWIACGRADGMWSEGIKLWDVAPGMLLIRESGGVATQSRGGVVAASSPQLHRALPLGLGLPS